MHNNGNWPHMHDLNTAHKNPVFRNFLLHCHKELEGHLDFTSIAIVLVRYIFSQLQFIERSVTSSWVLDQNTRWQELPWGKALPSDGTNWRWKCPKNIPHIQDIIKPKTCCKKYLKTLLQLHWCKRKEIGGEKKGDCPWSRAMEWAAPRKSDRSLVQPQVRAFPSHSFEEGTSSL